MCRAEVSLREKQDLQSVHSVRRGKVALWNCGCHSSLCKQVISELISRKRSKDHRLDELPRTREPQRGLSSAHSGLSASPSGPLAVWACALESVPRLHLAVVGTPSVLELPVRDCKIGFLNQKRKIQAGLVC